jgi:SagB-type dehydrogenase family enzyme
MTDDASDASPLALDELYHVNSKHSPVRLGFVTASQLRQRDRFLHGLYQANKNAFKTYTSSPKVALPSAGRPTALSVGDAIAARRSERTFAAESPSLEAIATLLAASYGAQGERGGVLARAVPSGGGLYPLDLYLLQFAGGVLDAGVYHYHVGDHCLQRVKARCERRALEDASIYPEIIAQVPLLLALVADMPRARVKYGERAYRLALLEAGHVSQNLYLLVQALGLGIVALDGFYDDRLHAVLGVDGVTEIALLLFALGRPR